MVLTVQLYVSGILVILTCWFLITLNNFIKIRGKMRRKTAYIISRSTFCCWQWTPVLHFVLLVLLYVGF